jgi:hypothetical protein
MPLGAILLYVVFAAMLWVWQPPGIGAEDSKAESKPARPSLMRWANVTLKAVESVLRVGGYRSDPVQRM